MYVRLFESLLGSWTVVICECHSVNPFCQLVTSALVNMFLCVHTYRYVWKCVCHCHCQIMRGLIKSCLQTAHGSSRTSISIPAIGTGNLRVPADITCWVMYDEVDKFSQSNATTSLKDVRFVVYDKDPSSIAVSLLISRIEHH